MEAPCGDLFDHIDDLLDFPCRDDLMLELPGAGAGGVGGLASLATDPPPLLPLPDDVFLSAAPPPPGASHAPCDDLDMAQLEWLSNFFDDAPGSAFLDIGADVAALETAAMEKEQEQQPLFRTPSPVSVLERNSFNSGDGGSGSAASFSSPTTSSSSSSTTDFSRSCGARPCPEPSLVIPARARSKRSRPAAFSARAHITVPIPPPTLIIAAAFSDPESIEESSPPPTPVKKKKKAKKARFAPDEEPAAARRCMHCKIEKTPQWRAGPMGPKTLCNACGVRYKSGRLFPEYRPAASPTFVPYLHSNSHKKVVEMRLNATAATGGCDLLEYIRRQD